MELAAKDKERAEKEREALNVRIFLPCSDCINDVSFTEQG
jgi:hypothetical protein